MIPVDPRFPTANQSTLPLTQRLYELWRLLANEINNGLNMYQLPETEIQITGSLKGQPARIYNIMGRRTQWVNTTDMHDACSFLTNAAGQQLFVELTGTEDLEIVSSSANDTSAGTGARTVHVTYIDSDGIQQEYQGITMNGTTPVSLSSGGGTTGPLAGALAIQWMEVATAGSGGLAVGNINLRSTSGTIYEQIVARGNRSLSCRYKVPANKDAYILSWGGGAINGDMDFRIRATVDMTTGDLSQVYLFEDVGYTPSNLRFTNEMRWLKVPSGGKIKVSAIPSSTGATVRCDISFFIACIEK